MICNSGNVGIPNLKLAPEINVSDGLLDVVVVGGLGIRSIIPVLISTFKSLFPGTRRDPHLKHWKAREITINARRKQMISLDGEPLKEKFPLMVKVLPGALRVVVPGGGGA